MSATDVPPVISFEPPSRVRPVLLRVALVTAFCSAAILLLDAVVHHQITAFLIEFDWYFLFGSWALLVFLLAVLLGALRDMIWPVNRAWSNEEHIDFIVLFCIFGYFLVPMFYFGALFSMINGGGGPDE